MSFSLCCASIFTVQLVIWCQAFTIFFCVWESFCRPHVDSWPGISHLGVYFIYESSVASKTNMRNAINQIKFLGSCFDIAHNNTFCFTMLKILGSVHRQPPILKHAETSLLSKWNISVLLKCSRRGSSYKVKIPWGPILPMRLCKCNMSFVFQTITWDENIAGYFYINTQNRVNHMVINIHFQRYLFFCWW